MEEREKFGGEVGDLNLVLYRREAQALEAQGVMNRVQSRGSFLGGLLWEAISSRLVLMRIGLCESPR